MWHREACMYGRSLKALRDMWTSPSEVIIITTAEFETESPERDTLYIKNTAMQENISGLIRRNVEMEDWLQERGIDSKQGIIGLDIPAVR